MQMFARTGAHQLSFCIVEIHGTVKPVLGFKGQLFLSSPWSGNKCKSGFWCTSKLSLLRLHRGVPSSAVSSLHESELLFLALQRGGV